MSRIANTPEARPYRSELRAEQAEETRRRILDAALRVMATGLASLSVPAVAREAGVSVPTVYRHFGTKAELLAGVYPHAARRPAWMVCRIRRPSTMSGSCRARGDRAPRCPGRREPRGHGQPDRRRGAARDDAVAVRSRSAASGKSIEPPLSKADLDRITRMLVILISSSSMRTWLDHLGVIGRPGGRGRRLDPARSHRRGTGRGRRVSGILFDGSPTYAWPMPPRSAARPPASAS